MFLKTGWVIRTPLTISYLKISNNIQKERCFFLKPLLFFVKKDENNKNTSDVLTKM